MDPPSTLTTHIPIISLHQLQHQHPAHLEITEIVASLPPELSEGVQASTTERAAKLATQDFSDAGWHNFQQSLPSLKNLEDAFLEHLVVSKKYFIPPSESTSSSDEGSNFWTKKSPKNTVDKKFEKAYTENKEKLIELQHQLSNYGIEISFAFVEENVKQDEINKMFADFIFDKERALNRIVNKMIYLQNAKLFMQENKDTIFKEMPILRECNIAIFEIDKIDFISQSGETHNQGKKPLYVSLKSTVEGNGEIRLVLKPRNASIDKYVIELFDKINKCDDNLMMPVYDIVNIGDFSVWQNIEGSNLKQLGCGGNESAFNFISYSKKCAEMPDEKRGY